MQTKPTLFSSSSNLILMQSTSSKPIITSSSSKGFLSFFQINSFQEFPQHSYNQSILVMGNQIFEKAVDYLIDLIKREVYPFINENIKSEVAKKLKSDIYFGLQQFKRDGKDFELTQEINHRLVKGRLKQQTGALRVFLNIRSHFSVKKVEIDGVTYLEGYMSVETKGIGCKWTIAADSRVRARVSI